MLVETDKTKTRGGSSVTQQALETQTSLLPYALAVFAVSLPLLVWAGSYASNAVWMTGTFAIFAIAWGVFYAAVNWLKEPQALNDLRKRGQIHIFCGLIWAAAVAQMAAFGDGAGPVRGELMLISVAAAVIVIFFTAPWLPSLLIVGSATAAGPLYFLLRNPADRTMANWPGAASPWPSPWP